MHVYSLVHGGVMKKILLVNESFGLGGIQSSMVNMANELSAYYDVDIFLYHPEGIMKNRINNRVRVLEPSWRLRTLCESFGEVFRTKSLKRITYKVFASVWTKLFTNRLPIRIALKHQKKMSGYDLAISYRQEQWKKSVASGFVRVVDECVDAKSKVAWIHFDSNVIDLDSSYNNKFYLRMDKIICVSRSLMESFAKNNPVLCNKVDYCYNFILYDEIKEKSNEKQQIEYDKGCFICFSACRLSSEKALVRAIDAMAETFRKHEDLRWYIAGDGPEREAIENSIKKRNLEKQIVLLGNQSNPYPYFKNADITINVSYHEAAPMVFLESKALGTPVFATETVSARELLNDQLDSFVCDNSAEGIADAFAYLMDNRDLIKKANDRLREYSATNESSFDKINSLVQCDYIG